ncbi:EamA family transporter RarD [Paracoccus tibetensis]|uniref:Chloramphenicol-sensitive protein RarD n=1 Tax=Paracoccus tibetensis TaxID=336292 RepID=A0A1G5JA42_9RHOB|nr:EamA family transporter RarD [Paracoccus tibetensis]SCY85064.1 chloramphenicol-sensitive protein RarD [Paracoccus tibetensis]
MSNAPLPQTDSPRGLVYAIAAYGIWGFLPIYMKALTHVPPLEVIAHRVIWSLPIAGAVLLWQGRQGEVLAALRQPRLLAMAALTAGLISVNWLIYVWAIANDHALDAALGYYINPLFSVFLGATLLKERLSRGQFAAIALAASAVVILTVQAGSLPLVAIGLTLSWGVYAYCKRSLPLGPNQGFTLEVLLLTPFAAGFLIWQALGGAGSFGPGQIDTTLLLLGAGPVTAIPLLFYANGAKLIRLSTIGILQYIAPTMIFLCAVFLFGEPFDGARLIAFPMIWAALVIYSVTLLRQAGQRRRDRRAAATKRMQ